MGKAPTEKAEASVLQEKDKEIIKVKKLKALTKKSSLLKELIAAVIVITVFWMTAFNSLAAEGEVTADTAKIRAQASVDSEVIASTVKGKKIDIVGVEKDSSGMKWYKVPVAGGGYGYIRSDLVKTSETLEVDEGSAAQSQPTTTTAETPKPADTVPTAIGEQQAVIKCDSNVKIRSGASTSHDVVTSLPNGTAITLVGEANDSAGNKWYQMTCSYNGRSIEGYVRSDLITIGAAPAAEGSEGGEGENPEEGTEVPEDGENPEGAEGEAPEGGEEPEPEPAPEEEHNDYEIRWAQNKDNEEYDYFLYDNIAQNRMRLSEVMNAVTASDENVQKLQEQVDKDKIIIIVLAAVIVLFFIIVTILLLKLRSLYYEDYDEEDEEDEEEEEEVVTPVRKKVKKRVEEEEEAPPVRKKKPSSQREEAPVRRESERPAKSRKVSAGEAELRAAERKESPKKPASRKPQNFLVDDDEFEFEFLNMDDKDL